MTSENVTQTNYEVPSITDGGKLTLRYLNWSCDFKADAFTGKDSFDVIVGSDLVYDLQVCELHSNSVSKKLLQGQYKLHIPRLQHRREEGKREIFVIAYGIIVKE